MQRQSFSLLYLILIVVVIHCNWRRPVYLFMNKVDCHHYKSLRQLGQVYLYHTNTAPEQRSRIFGIVSVGGPS